ncbi:HlyD family secretion protein [Ereboglobus sp. PH5-5]|uniref:efflux RND transporter periplasmic adaptor subunit n=1 Tax=Ereboglobus sp. PH5-5 TaxID=2940529 RepID=UPI002406B93D|nr:efflux RND transporter periplasmic adaptor subunit [Ereboglobus sp. PH5-5]MDF9833090.1 HlyD family secretion protein [Ereboglobus sp. PH5-5]
MKSNANENPSATGNLSAIIQKEGKGSRRTWIIVVIALLAAVVAAVIWYRGSVQKRAAAEEPPFITETLRRGNLALDITATGNLEPTNEVTVGSELSGTVLEVYVETNDRVTKGQPLLKLDTTKLSQQTESSRASLASAKAALAQNEATLKEAQAALARQQELQRVSNGRIPSRADMDTAVAAADRAAANVLAAKASIAQAQAQLDINETDLSKAIIKSPIDGIILTRSIEPGQTVAASFTAPELFVIAENLEHMKLKVTIAEADIGRVAAGQKATFTVDAWPNRTYTASVTKVAYGSAVTNNVVTYETELEVSNNDLSLRPGMTATADISVAEAKNVFLVPVAAFRFDPSTLAPPGAGKQSKSFVQSIMPGPPRRQTARPAANGDASEKSANGTARIHILKDGHPQPVTVKVGISDSRHTEVSGDALAEGMQIITNAR